MNRTFLLQQVLNGLAIGSVYAIFALGYTLIYGILEMLNFAHGDVYMVGAFLAAGVAGVLVHDEVAAVPAGLAVALMMVVAMGVLSTPNSCARNGATPVATPAMVQHRAQA